MDETATQFASSRVSEIRAANTSNASQRWLHGASIVSRPMGHLGNIVAELGRALGEMWSMSSGQTYELYESERGSRFLRSRSSTKSSRQEILVVLDDLALPLGRLRLRAGGGSGGHNGLESVIVQFGTEEIPRLRVGIGAAPTRRMRSTMCWPLFR